MSRVIARTYCGAIDLYHGLPDLLSATVIDVDYDNRNEDHMTTLVFKDTKGNEHRISIAEAN
jgi:hypothetical protein